MLEDYVSKLTCQAHNNCTRLWAWHGNQKHSSDLYGCSVRLAESKLLSLAVGFSWRIGAFSVSLFHTEELYNVSSLQILLYFIPRLTNRLLCVHQADTPSLLHIYSASLLPIAQARPRSQLTVIETAPQFSSELNLVLFSFLVSFLSQCPLAVNCSSLLSAILADSPFFVPSYFSSLPCCHWPSWSVSLREAFRTTHWFGYSTNVPCLISFPLLSWLCNFPFFPFISSPSRWDLPWHLVF